MKKFISILLVLSVMVVVGRAPALAQTQNNIDIISDGLKLLNDENVSQGLSWLKSISDRINVFMEQYAGIELKKALLYVENAFIWIFEFATHLIRLGLSYL